MYRVLGAAAVDNSTRVNDVPSPEAVESIRGEL
jgi:hypothetical protein